MATGEQTKPLLASSPITITHRTDLSLLYRGLCFFIKPLRPHLATSKRQYPAGSPRLEKHPRHIGKVTVIERGILIPSKLSLDPEINPESNAENLWVYDYYPTGIENNDGRASQAHTVYYFAGGGFQAPGSSEHWKFCAHLASSLSRSRVVLVSYPLAPHSPAKVTLPFLRRWLVHELQDARVDGRVVSLAGDSSGANIALSLGLWCADQLAMDRSAAEGSDRSYFHQLKSILVISPPTDLRASGSNPSTAKTDAGARDPVLGFRISDAAATAWTADSEDERRDPYVSLILADLSSLRASGIRVNGVIGTADVLAPEASSFMERCGGEGVRGEWLVWDGQMHCFPLTACYGLREGVEGRDWVIRVLEVV
ncbi:Alpha/Beta hydrolase protein [Rostrohypoxylon terebratum]|nr:Alpha/Beta hydrolase protein [Rostrohypoxylon terebratum]